MYIQNIEQYPTIKHRSKGNNYSKEIIINNENDNKAEFHNTKPNETIPFNSWKDIQLTKFECFNSELRE